MTLTHLKRCGKSEKKGGEKKKGNEREKNQEADGEDRDHGNSWDARSNGNARERSLFCPCAAMGENQACSASNFHMSISAQLRTALWNQSSRKYP